MEWRPPLSRKDRLIRWLIATAVLVCYFGSYIAFTVWGQYVPDVRPDGSIARHTWAPGEFYNYAEREWRPGLVALYFPLWWIDRTLWHTEGKVQSGRYPVKWK